MKNKVEPTVEKWERELSNIIFEDTDLGIVEADLIKSRLEKLIRTLLSHSVQEAKAEEDNRTYLFVENYLKSWGGYYNAEKEYKHIESTRITKKALLKEISLLCKWQERALDRTKGAMEMIKKLSSGEKVSNQDLLSTLNTKDSLKQEEEKV